MLKTGLIHPGILGVLGHAGHGSKVLIADGNFPCSTTLGPNAILVNLNLSPGIVTCAQVLQSIVWSIPIEAVAVMETLKDGPYAMEEDPPAWNEFRRILKEGGFEDNFDHLERQRFYQAASTPEVALVIATADQALYANLLITIGVVMPGRPRISSSR